MPTIDRINGFRFMIFPNDHRPAHVHVFKGGAMAIIEIESLEVREGEKMDQRDVNSAVRYVAERRGLFARKWEEIHGRR
jgi:hypothetical protein